MNSTFYNHVSAHRGPVARIERFVRNMIEDHAARRARRVARRELRRLAATSPHLLLDIGCEDPAPAGTGHPTRLFGW
ncbi:MAG: hypothetical protein PHS60_02850 [Zavarzinia sp.]|nr:hypothetical protein [Zavarzinia sp.]